MLTPEQRYRQAMKKALIMSDRNVRRFLAGELQICPAMPMREYLTQEIGRAYEAGKRDGMMLAKATSQGSPDTIEPSNAEGMVP